MAEAIQAASANSSASNFRRMNLSAASLIFGEWCLRREAPSWPPGVMRMAVLLPVISAWWLAAVVWPDLRLPGAGPDAIRHLIWIAAFVILIGGVQFASKAVCWEVSAEMRDIVRLTDLDARVLLWLKTLACWWTIGWSVLLLLPFLLFAITLGGVSSAQLVAGAYGLVLLSVLVGAFAMLAGVLTIDSKNPEKSAATMTSLGLIFYNLAFMLLGQVVYWSDMLLHGHVSSSMDMLSRRIAVCAPQVSVQHALSQSALFNPADPGYWLHFLTAVACVAFASVVIEVRFRSSVSEGDATSSSERASLQQLGRRKDEPGVLPLSNSTGGDVARTGSTQVNNAKSDLTQQAAGAMEFAPVGNRSRCTDHPFFWKDVYVLSDERKWVNTWTLFYVVATFGVMFAIVAGWDFADRYWIAFASFLSIGVTAIIVAMRFDALVTAEFRDRTWGSLMLLPVDPVDLLRTKLIAALYEQRFAFLPTGLALAALMVRGPASVAISAWMTVSIALLVSSLLCQLSCINQLLGKAWWLGPVQILGAVGVALLTIIVWITLRWIPGFFAAALLLGGIIAVIHHWGVVPLTRTWVEP